MPMMPATTMVAPKSTLGIIANPIIFVANTPQPMPQSQGAAALDWDNFCAAKRGLIGAGEHVLLFSVIGVVVGLVMVKV